MKTTIVPAQITTIEDKVAGSLTISQLLLLAAPIFISSAFYICLPPFMRNVPYKLVLIVCIFVGSSILAIRVKGKLVLSWLVVLLRYELRLRYYLANKNSMYGRDGQPDNSIVEMEALAAVVPQRQPLLLPSLSMADVVKLEAVISNPLTKLNFTTTKKGGLSVHIAEIKEQN